MSEFDQRTIDEAKRRHKLSELLQRDGVKLIRRGQEFEGLCPFHNEKTPSFRVVDAKSFYHCFGCGAHGDAVSWRMERHGETFIEAVKSLGGSSPSRAAVAPIAPVPEYRAPAADADRQLRARDLWFSSAAIAGTPGERYFRARGIEIALPPTLRFNPALVHPSRAILPGIVAGVQNLRGSIIAVHRIFLDPATIDSDRVHKTLLLPDKALLGSPKGGAVRLAPLNSFRAWLGRCEGIETGLAVLQAMPQLPVWAAVAASFLPFVALPPEIKEVIELADRDAVCWTPGPLYGLRPGEYWSRRAAVAAHEAGKRSRIALPAKWKADFNDLLQ